MRGMIEGEGLGIWKEIATTRTAHQGGSWVIDTLLMSCVFNLKPIDRLHKCQALCPGSQGRVEENYPAQCYIQILTPV